MACAFGRDLCERKLSIALNYHKKSAAPRSGDLWLVTYPSRHNIIVEGEEVRPPLLSER